MKLFHKSFSFECYFWEIISLSFYCRESAFSLWWFVRFSFCFQSFIISQQYVLSVDFFWFYPPGVCGHLIMSTYIFFSSKKKIWKIITSWLFKDWFSYFFQFWHSISYYILLLKLLKVKVKSISHVRLFATLWTVAHQASPSMGFSRQEYWSGLPFPFPGDLPDPGIKPSSPAVEADALTSEPPNSYFPSNGLWSILYVFSLYFLCFLIILSPPILSI